MPYTIKGEQTYGNIIDIHDSDVYRASDFKYKYPEGLILKPGTDEHAQLRTKIMANALESRHEISKRFPYWREVDRSLTTYMWLKDSEELTKSVDPQKPVSIVFPYSYSNLEALLVYLSMAFFQDPIFQYEGFRDDDFVGGMLMEQVVRLHCIKNKVALNLHTMFRDALAYGVGSVIPWWKQLFGSRPVRSVSGTESPFGQMQSRGFSMVPGLLFEGNALENIDPYMLLPDPSVSSVDHQKGEFIGWVQRTNYSRLVELESQPDKELFNVKYLSLNKEKRSILALDQSSREDRYGGSSDIHKAANNIYHPVDVIHMYVNLIPREWKLSDKTFPEKWYFQLAQDDIIIHASPADHAHGQYSLAMCSPEFDGYETTPIGRLEVLHGLQHVLNFLFNSHISNVKKAINDMIVVDPYLININDLKDPGPGKLIRLRRPAWGKGVKDAVQQLQITDITRLNISDAAFITQWMDRISGSDQSLSGTQRQGGPERLTSTEFDSTHSSAISRLQHLAQVIGFQAMQDIGTQFAYNTQEYMSQETYIKIIGRYAEELKAQFPSAQRSLKVSPYDIAVETDLIVRDGSVPGGAFIGEWIDLFKTIAPDQELRQQFDIVKMFMFIAHQSGAKNIEDFRRVASNVQVQQMSDQKVQDQVDAGNLIPVNGEVPNPAPETTTPVYEMPIPPRRMGWR